MKSRCVFGTRFFATNEIRLGNLIPNIQEPDLNNLQSPMPLDDDVVTIKEVEDCSVYSQSQGSYGLSIFLPQIFTASSNRAHSENDSLSARRGRIYTLNQAKNTFRKLCDDEKTRRWFEEQIGEGNDVHFVVGLQTLFGAEKQRAREQTAKDFAQLAIPPAKAPAITNLGIEADHGETQQDQSIFRVPGENIYGVRLQKVIFDFWTKSVETAKLERGCYWLTVSDNRGSADYAEYVQAFLGSDENEIDGEQATEGDHEPLYICDIEGE